MGIKSPKTRNGSDIIEINKISGKNSAKKIIEYSEENSAEYFIFGNENTPPSIILELCEMSLVKKNEKGFRNNTEKVKYIIEIILGMCMVHKSNIIHRDLKPHNIIIDIKNHAKICDFGLATLADRDAKSEGVGTYNYMAPEIFGEIYDHKVDIYSFGVLLIFILSGTVPKKKDGVLIIPDNLNEFSKELIRKCTSLNPELRPEFSEIFQECEKNQFLLDSDVQKEAIEERIQQIKHEEEINDLLNTKISELL